LGHEATQPVVVVAVEVEDVAGDAVPQGAFGHAVVAQEQALGRDEPAISQHGLDLAVTEDGHAERMADDRGGGEELPVDGVRVAFVLGRERVEERQAGDRVHR
jgi:hypothetical protein